MNETAGKILKILEDRKEPVSGEEISRILGITRSAVWKDIKELKALGYSINSSRTDGYELVSATAGLLPHEIEKYLKTRFIGRDIRYFEKTESTTWVAKDLCVKNDISTLDGTVIIAEEQTGGYGRLGRAWASPKGGIWTTIILKPDISVDRLFFITMAASIAVARTIRNMYDVGALIKWPNDIFIGDKKVCGIYLEISAEADVIHHCLLGIGIDANVKPEVFHNNVPVAVTSLKDETGADINRVEFFAQFLKEFELRYDFVMKNDFEPILKEWKSLSYTLDHRVRVTTPRKTLEGEAMDIDDHGALIIKKDNGTIEKVVSGDCTPI
ncbi:MAG: biotin--[Methanomicrobium sp.]|nr:biotin--[acetyl-CoA-carboxylase] ligase [Methanomicrobium sp.]MBO4522696.1 biotin--[acetyl-CoA-carboxylase] ligase [Methanomicrobium sp.]MBR6010766.1 biotin--[acetyl-CoA-carboxylase] ligase [Methanomicrobium sp.]MBR6447325.1 biotin--[acetyl-CoA-carboxylase] ligase [Methanomicrobium sp.]MBR6497175.1 biotin--[acetyl-CoA-carboxylase] ligase [Methanomicrobium sp.]